MSTPHEVARESELTAKAREVLEALSPAMFDAVDDLRERSDGTLYSVHGHNMRTWDAIERRGIIVCNASTEWRRRWTDLGREVRRLLGGAA